MGIKYDEADKTRLREEFFSGLHPTVRAVVLGLEWWLHNQRQISDIVIINVKRTQEEQKECKGILGKDLPCPHMWEPSYAVDLRADFPEEMEDEVRRYLLDSGAGPGSYFKSDNRGRYLHIEAPMPIPVVSMAASERAGKLIQ